MGSTIPVIEVAHPLRRATVVAIASVVAAAVVSAAGARSMTASSTSPSIYWANYTAGTLSFANLNGHGAGTVATGATHPQGVAIDAAADKIWWVNACGCALAWKKLDGSDAGNVGTGGATTVDPSGLAGDFVAGKVYWADYQGAAISWAQTDGGGGGDIDTTGATLNGPTGVALDPVHHRIYWSNYLDNAHPIAWVSLNGGGAHNLSTAGATADGATSVALDLTSGKVYWTNSINDTLSYASLSGGGGGQLDTTGATIHGPQGIAIDHAAGKLYWANYGANTISSIDLGGGSGADLNTTGTTVSGANFVALFERPVDTALPAVSGAASPGHTLTCDPGTWADDAGASLYRRPSAYAYMWRRDGVDNGAASVTYQVQPADVGHQLRCRVTATNRMGSAAANSDPVQVFAADGSGTLTASPVWVPNASTGRTISLKYTTAAGGIANGTVRIAVPSGWSAPSTAASDPGYTTSTVGSVSFAGQAITVSGVTRAAGQTLTVTYGATSGGGPGASSTSTAGGTSWFAKSRSTSGGTLTSLAVSPAIDVLSADGAGAVATATTSVVHGSAHHAIVFTYVVQTGGVYNGTLTLAVPSGWSAPSTTATAPGYAVANYGTVKVSGRTIIVSNLYLGDQTVVITYGSKAGGGPGATAPAKTGAQHWSAKERSWGGGALTALAAPPSITVT